MASTLRALNSIGGFSVGDDPQIVIVQANGDITSGNITANGFANINGNLIANAANFSGNVNISNANATWGLLTDNLYYSNGAPWDLSNPGGANTDIQFNDNGTFGGSSSFQFNSTSNTLTITGTSNVTGNLNVTQRINGNVANFSGNLTSLNASLGNLATANYVNVAVDLLVSGNANIVLDLQGNTANFSGNIKSLNANLGNLGTANFINVSSNLNVTNTANVGNLNVTNNVTSNLIPNVSNTYTLGNATNMWKDLYLSGTSIYIGTQNITANGTAIAVSNDFASNNFFATNNVTANGNVYANAGGGAGYVYANFANVQSNLYVGANANIVNTLTAANIKDTNLANSQIVYANASNTLVGSTTFTYDAPNQVLKVGAGGTELGGDSGYGYIQTTTGNFSGNINSLNANLGNLATANYINVAANLVVSGNANFNSAANVSLGAVGNVHITGGTNGYVLTTDGSGGLSWSATAATNEIQNGNSNVSIPTANGNVYINATGTEQWVFGTDGKLTAPGDIQTNGTINANVILAALDITSSGGNLNANTGTVNAGTANISGNLSANNANITSTLTANVANVTTLNVANVTTTGNITANNVTVNLELAGNTANFSGQVNLNANANVTNNLTVGGNITTSGAGGNITMSGGNISGANVIFANTANISSQINGVNANFTGNVTAANFIGTLANGTSNISIATDGNVTINPGGFGGNAFVFADHVLETGTAITATGNITSNATIIANTFTAYANTSILISAGSNTGNAGNFNVTLTPTGPNGVVAVSGARITNLAEPTGDQDAATKYYVDQVAQGLNIHDSALAATTNTLTILTGGTITYNNGASGVGANLVLTGSPTANFLSANVFDGNVTAVVSSRILVKNEANAAYNGIYVVDSATVMTRAADFNSVPEIEPGDFIFVQDGTTYNDSGWVQTSVVVVVGTDPITFTQFSGAGSYTANTAAGLVLNGSVFSAKTDGVTTAFDGGGNIYIPANATLTTPNIGAATGTSINLTGSVLANYVNANVSLNTLGDINALTGNITGNYISVQQNLSVTGYANANNVTVTNNISAGSANVTNNLQGNTANFSGNLIAANANLGSGILLAGNANVTGTLNGNVANFSGNLTAANASLGNLVTANFANISSNLVVSGTANIATINATGNVLANNITSNNRVTATNVKIGNSYIYANTVTTSSTTPTEICSFMITNTDVYGIEYIIKSFDGTGSKYSMATVQAVTNGTDVDYVTYATVRLGNTTGQLSVTRTAVGLDVSINLIATPSTSNSTVWTTQYRLI